MRYFLEENLQWYGSIHLCYLWPPVKYFPSLLVQLLLLLLLLHYFSFILHYYFPSFLFSFISIFLHYISLHFMLDSSLTAILKCARWAWEQLRRNFSKYDKWNVDVKYNMTVLASWCSKLRSPVSLRGHLLLCCRKYNLKLKSSDCTRQTGGKSVFQRRGLWLLAGTSGLAFAAFNRLWERKQRRKLRVHVEGIGRFFRWCASHTMDFEKFSFVPHFVRKRIHNNHHHASWSPDSTFLKRCDQKVHHHSLENEHK